MVSARLGNLEKPVEQAKTDEITRDAIRSAGDAASIRCFPEGREIHFTVSKANAGLILKNSATEPEAVYFEGQSFSLNGIPHLSRVRFQNDIIEFGLVNQTSNQIELLIKIDKKNLRLNIFGEASMLAAYNLGRKQITCALE